MFRQINCPYSGLPACEDPCTDDFGPEPSTPSGLQGATCQVLILILFFAILFGVLS